MESLTATWLGIIGGLIAIFLWFLKKNDDKKKKVEDENKNIDKANDADSLLRIFDRLRNK
jgi:H+/gluconate symporter-like permease